jgi:hypothetical protein
MGSPYAAAIVTAAGNAVQVWPAGPYAPAAIPGFNAEARVLSIDPATNTIRARMTDIVRIVVIRVVNAAMLSQVRVGSTVYLDTNRNSASFDGKTAVGTFSLETKPSMQ